MGCDVIIIHGEADYVYGLKLDLLVGRTTRWILKGKILLKNVAFSENLRKMTLKMLRRVLSNNKS